MAQTPRSLLVLAFASCSQAQNALLALRKRQLDCVVQIHDAVFIEKDEAGHVATVETLDPELAPSTVGVGFWGALVGTLVAGPFGTVVGAVASAGLGALTATLLDLGIPDATVAELEAATPPGSAALALLVSDVNEAALALELTRFERVKLVRSDLSPQTVRRLREALARSNTAERE